jgi:hypothetical protein
MDLRFDIAKSLGVQAADSPDDDVQFLKDVLAECKYDEQWNTAIPDQAACAKRGEKRYFYVKDELSTVENSNIHEEENHKDLNKNRAMTELVNHNIERTIYHNVSKELP